MTSASSTAGSKDDSIAVAANLEGWRNAEAAKSPNKHRKLKDLEETYAQV